MVVARRCAHCGQALIRRVGEHGMKWTGRKTCSRTCANAQRSISTRERIEAIDEAFDDADGWPEIDRYFRWPDGVRFEDSPSAIRDRGSLQRLGLPPDRASYVGSSSAMCIAGGEGSTGGARRVRA